MRYLSTLLLTTTFLSATSTYGSTIAATDDSISHSADDSTISFSLETQAKIDAFEGLVFYRSEFNVSDAAEILFSPEIFPLISWRSSEKNKAVVSQLGYIAQTSISRGYTRNNLFIVDIIRAITLSDNLENRRPPHYHISEGIANPSLLNEFVDGTICWGWYPNVLSQYDLTFNPELRLKIYLELLQQTNITPDSLGHILRTTIQLTQMFMSKPKKAFKEAAEDLKSWAVQQLDSYSFRYRYLALKERIENGDSSKAFALLQESFDTFATRIDENFNNTQEKTNRFLTSFGPNAVALFSEIFERIAIHPKTKAEDKITAAEMQKHANASSDLLIRVYYQIAQDPTRDIKDRITDIHKLIELNATPQAISAATAIANDSAVDMHYRLTAAKILVETGISKDAAINIYTAIIETIENTAAIMEKDKFDYLVDVGIGLHKVGATELGLDILTHQFRWLNTNSEKHISVYINTNNVITMTEILYNAGKSQIDRML